MEERVKKNIGILDLDKTNGLYLLCNGYVFKECAIEDFVNGMNNPKELTLKIELKSRLYVLLSYYGIIFGDFEKDRRKEILKAFNISADIYNMKKAQNTSSKNKEFIQKLSSILGC